MAYTADPDPGRPGGNTLDPASLQPDATTDNDTPQPGPGRPWEAGLSVGTYAQANTRHRNLFTAIPIVGWSGSGPDVRIVLYHNAANVASEMNLTRAMGFDLGEGWTISYSAQLLLTPIEVTSIADDGTQDVFTLDNGNWQAPPGVHGILTQNADGWRITHKNQSYHQFDSEGLLTELVDSTGNVLTITRGADGRLEGVADASGRIVQFVFSAQGRLSQIVDPPERDESDTNLHVRMWKLSHDNAGRLSQIADPMGFNIGLNYDGSGRITKIADKDGDAYQYHYKGGILATVTAPKPKVGPTTLKQKLKRADVTFEASFVGGSSYVDFRGAIWTYLYDRSGHLCSMRNPLGAERRLMYDADRNVTRYTDPLGNESLATFDARGNLLTQIDPLGRVRSWTYDAYNNTTSYIDADGETVSFNYALAGLGYPTLLTSVVEPPATAGGAPATTWLQYYASSDPPLGSKGLLKAVTDPNGVITDFSYDYYGQPAVYREGVDQTYGSSLVYVYESTTGYNSAGFQTYGGTPSSGGLLVNDLLGRAVAAGCFVKSEFPTAGANTPGFPRMPCDADAVELPEVSDAWSATYTNMGQLGSFDYTNDVGRDFSAQYDVFGMMTEHTVEGNQAGTQVARTFTYAYDRGNGTYTRVGPDYVTTIVNVDLAGRVRLLRRGPVSHPTMSAAYAYFDDDRLASVTYGNGASTHYTYDAARRMTMIEHRDGVGQVMLRMSYTFDAHDLPVEVVEGDSIGQVAATTYTYDTRGRLVKEDRIGANPYAMVYAYDQGGNRTRKIDAHRDVEVVYHYDVDDPFFYRSRANRLMYYETFDTPDDASPVLVSTTWYYYNDSGNVTRVVTSDAGSDAYQATRLAYATNGQVVMYLLNETWTADGDNCPANYLATHGREFKYDGARQRYLDGAFNVEANGSFTTTEETWTDYDDDNAYGDYTIDGSGGGGPGAITNIRSFEPGIGRVDPWQSAGDGSTSYAHADHIGSRRRTSNDGGAESTATVYTAFGERISGDPVTTETRHAYAGEYGYQSHADFPFMHVGHRYYDPATGRFLQRDPIGIRGGLNVYAYVRNTPTILVDPNGLRFFQDFKENVQDFALVGGCIGTVVGGVGGGVVGSAAPGGGTLVGIGTGSVAGAGVGGVLGGLMGAFYTVGGLLTPIVDAAYAPSFQAINDPHPDRPHYRYICFVAGTEVATVDCVRPIEEIVAGDIVFTTDLAARASVIARVTSSGITGTTRDLIEVRIDGDTFRSTITHPYWTANRGWIEAENLNKSDVLQDMEGNDVRILEVKSIHLRKPVPVYDISVEGYHWFYIGTRRILVHNS